MIINKSLTFPCAINRTLLPGANFNSLRVLPFSSATVVVEGVMVIENSVWEEVDLIFSVMEDIFEGEGCSLQGQEVIGLR